MFIFYATADTARVPRNRRLATSVVTKTVITTPLSFNCNLFKDPTAHCGSWLKTAEDGRGVGDGEIFSRATSHRVHAFKVNVKLYRPGRDKSEIKTSAHNTCCRVNNNLYPFVKNYQTL